MFFTLSHHLLLPFLFLTGLVAGTVDAIAGGGGLISVPVLFGVGIPPHLALGTNKFQSSCGTFMAAWSYYRQGLIDKSKLLLGLIFTFFGSVAGAITTQILSGETLKKIIPVVLLLILIYTLLTPHFGKEEQPAKISERVFFIIFGFLLGFYDGFLGPGVGSLWVFGFMFFIGFHLIKATAYTKIFNLNTNLVALACFAIGHHVDYSLGLCMAVGALMGGRLGAYLAIKKGVRLIRFIFILVVTASVVTLFYKNYANAFFLDHTLLSPIKYILPIFLTVSIGLVYYWKMKKQRN